MFKDNVRIYKWGNKLNKERSAVDCPFGSGFSVVGFRFVAWKPYDYLLGKFFNCFPVFPCLVFLFKMGGTVLKFCKIERGKKKFHFLLYSSLKNFILENSKKNFRKILQMVWSSEKNSWKKSKETLGKFWT